MPITKIYHTLSSSKDVIQKSYFSRIPNHYVNNLFQFHYLTKHWLHVSPLRADTDTSCSINPEISLSLCWSTISNNAKLQKINRQRVLHLYSTSHRQPSSTAGVCQMLISAWTVKPTGLNYKLINMQSQTYFRWYFYSVIEI